MRGGERRPVVRARDRVAELGGRACAMVQQIALRDHADGCTGGVHDTQVPHTEAIHPAEGSIEHLLAAHRLYRCTHDRRHGRHVRVDARIRRRPEQVAFGNDSGRQRMLAGDEERADPMLGHHAGGLAKRSLGPDRPRGNGHHLVEPAPVQEAVDAGEGGRRCLIRRVTRHRMPSCLRFAADEVDAPGGQCLGFAEGAHVRLPKPRDERGEDPGRGERVAQRIVARLDGDAEPIRERYEPEIDKPPVQHPREVRDVEGGRVAPRHAGTRRLVAQHGEVEADVLADHNTALRAARRASRTAPRAAAPRRRWNRSTRGCGWRGREWGPPERRACRCGVRSAPRGRASPPRRSGPPDHSRRRGR